MNKKFLKPSSLLLSKISQPVPLSQIDSPKVNGIIQKMLKIANGKQKDQNKPLGCKAKLVTSFPLPMWEYRVEEFTGHVARIFQHEVDHLLVEPEEFHLYRNRGAWRNWPKKASLPPLA